MDIDWLTSSEEDRKRLYAVTHDVGNILNMSVEQVMDAALGRRAPIGTDYVANFRKGKIRRSFAKLIYEWIAEHHSDLGRKVEASWFPDTNTDAWEVYLAEHAIHGKLRIARFGRTEMGLVQRAKGQPKPDEVLKLGEEFCFHLESDGAGYAVAFQGYKGQWHPMPLGDTEELATRLIEAAQFLPSDAEGMPAPLVETEDLGHHTFIVALAERTDQLPTQEAPPPNGSSEVHMVRVQFVP